MVHCLTANVLQMVSILLARTLMDTCLYLVLAPAADMTRSGNALKYLFIFCLFSVLSLSILLFLALCVACLVSLGGPYSKLVF